MLKELDHHTLVTFASERRLSSLPSRTLTLLYEHRDDPDFWRPRPRPEDDAVRLITERDSRGRIMKRVIAFAGVEGSGDHFGFAYEEWEYDDSEGTAVMHREQPGGFIVNEYTRRVYRDGAMTEEVTAVRYFDGSGVIELVRPVRPIDQTGGGVVYARQAYKPERVGTALGGGTQANPTSQIELGSHQGSGRAIGFEDCWVETQYYEHLLGLLDLSYQFDTLKIPRSAATWWVTNRVRPEVTVEGTDFKVRSYLGEVTFPQQLDFNQVFNSLKF